MDQLPAPTVDVDTSPAPMLDSEICEPLATDAQLADTDRSLGTYAGQGPTRSSVLSRAMRRSIEKRRTQHQLRVYQTAVLIAQKRMTQTQVAHELGLTQGHVSQLWTEAKRQMGMDFAKKEDREGMVAYVLDGYLEVFENNVARSSEDAASGAVALKAGESIATLCGLDASVLRGDGKDGVDGVSTLIEHIRGRSMVLGDHQAKIDAIKAKRDKGQADDPPAVPVE